MLDPDEAIDRISQVYGGPHGSRGLHAKGRFYAGTFTAAPEAAELCRAPHLQGERGAGDGALVQRRRPSAILRQGAGHPRHGGEVPYAGGCDRPARADRRRASRSATRRRSSSSPRPARKPYLLPLFLARHPSAAPTILANLRSRTLVPPHSFAEVPYYPIHAYGWLGGSWAPGPGCATSSARRPRVRTGWPRPSTDRDRLAEEMAARLDRGPRPVRPAGDGGGRRRRPARPDVGVEGLPGSSAPGSIEVTSTSAGPGGRRWWPGGLRPGAGGRRDHAVGGPDPAVPAARLLDVGVPPVVVVP